MPICTRTGLDKKADPVEQFQDNEKVFFCELTKEIFRNYEDYFQRVMLLNSTIWSCAETGKQNLTYSEALKSERRARKTGENVPEFLKGIALMTVEAQQQRSFVTLTSKVFSFMKERLFKGEEVVATRTKHNYVPCKVVEVIAPKEVPEDGVYDPKTVKYQVQRIQYASETWVNTITQAHRRRNVMTLEMLKSFLKENLQMTDEYIRVKPEAYEKYVTSKKLTFASVYVGNMPKWKTGRKIQRDLVQASMGNYVVKDAESSQKELETLKESMERMRREKEEKHAEIERKRAEMMAKIEEDLNLILRKTDDLERVDQKPMPRYKPVKTLVASKYFSEFLMIQEFLHSFAPILSASDVFRTNISFQQMCRAFLIREVAGPLSDILQVLLSTIFTLQIEENNDCPVRYMKSRKEGFLWNAANSAVASHMYVKNYFSSDMFELPIDAQSLTEILRLHLLSSGAPSDERSEAYRYQYRNGYSVTEDPGLLLRVQYPHILRALKMYTIYQLPFKDILKVLNCLIEQILTYNATITCLEERHEKLGKVRFNIRMLLARENKRAQNVQNMKKTIQAEALAQIAEHKDDAEKKAELERGMQRKLKEVEDQDAREKGNFEYELNLMNAELFDYLTLLGTDRAYRNYYVFESLPGLFIEHQIDEEVPCMENPPKNDDEMVLIPKERQKLKSFLLNRYKQNDKENVIKSNEISASTPVVLVNGDANKLNGSLKTTNLVGQEPNTAVDLYMCSGDKKNCIVHDPKHPSRCKWSFINTKEEFDALVDSLNNFGIRESQLKETLIKMKKNILPHMEKCPIQILSVDLMEREQSMSQMLTETQKKYANSNFGFPENADINEVMHTTLTQQILEFEAEITDGNLGKMKVPDLDKWRSDLGANSFNSQCKKLKYGPPETKNGEDAHVVVDPGNDLGDTLDIESEDSSDECVSVHDSPTLRQNVTNLATALLQIEQCIEQKFLKEPFGLRNELKDRQEMEAKLAQGKARLQAWEVSLMNSTSYSQIFLHLNILSDAVKWFKSSMKSSCLICRRKGDADKLLLCDECNAGTHMFCMKPPMKKIPEGNWYCFRCELKLGISKPGKPKKKARKIFSMEDDEDEKCKKQNESESGSDYEKPNKKRQKRKVTSKTFSDSEDEKNTSTTSDEEDNLPLITNGYAKKIEQKKIEEKTVKENHVENEEITSEDSDADGDVCKTCNTDATDLSCCSCKDCYHLECTGLRRMPRGNWLCSSCKSQEDKKRKVIVDSESESSNDEEYEETESTRAPKAKRQRRSKAKDNNISSTNDDVNKNNNNSRRIRRTDEFLKLDTIALYDLLDQVMKHEDAWPFLRPVSQSEVPDYHTIIKNPMDFARIKSKLNMCRYRTNDEVMSDIQLVFRNCDTYNTQGNDIYRAGASLERFVVEKCKELNLKFNPSDMISEAA